MTYVKKFIVWFLESLCTWTSHRWCRHLALRSSELDEKWGTNVWKLVPVRGPNTGDYYDEL